MSRLAAGLMIAVAALLMNGGLVKQVLAEQAVSRQPIVAATIMSPTPAAGHRSERVLSLVLALEALRAAPGLLDPHKV